MYSKLKKTFFGAVFLNLVFLLVVCGATLQTGEEREKFGKPGKKATEWPQSDKKTANKVAARYEEAAEHGRIDLAEASVYEAQPRLMPGKDRDLDSPSAGEKKSEAEVRQKHANRFRRNYDWWLINQSLLNIYRHPAEPPSSRAGDNYKNHVRSKRDGIVESTRADPRPHSNASDYYAQRKAVMERFYARQRQISERLAQHSTTTTPKSVLWSEHKQNFPYETSIPTTTGAPIRLPQQDTLNLNLLKNQTDSATTDDGVGLTPPNHHREFIENYQPSNDRNYQVSRTSSNVAREAPYENQPANCDNIPRSGSYASKRSSSEAKKCAEDRRGDMEVSSDDSATNTSATENKQWGTCAGKVVYQHNLLLGLKGPSNLDTRLDVAIQGPICITCVQIRRFNNTRAVVTPEGGGPGHQFITLRLKGFENEGFSYIVKVWGVRKTSTHCEKS